ncbi:MAG: KEOPS complex N(6)-L-threonylcarbamoyladenine synthase Kae1 [Nanoarchaeota archaeon]
MLILGCEFTAHTFGVGIVDSTGNILANTKDSYTTAQQVGLIPNLVAAHHEQVAEKILAQAFQVSKAAGKNIGGDDIAFIAYSAGPGLDPCLLAGYKIVKAWAEKFGKRLVGVNHCAAHLSIGKLWNKVNDPCYLYVSGVNTQIIVQEGGKYRIVGETLDLGLGNMLDKFARILGLGFPGGPKIEELAKKGNYVELPYVVKGMDVSFSGILTKSEQLLKKGFSKEDLCFSLQETCFAMLTEVVERALAHTEKSELVLVGGVGANKRFGEMLQIMCRERGAQFYNVPRELATDNGAMIAWEGYLRYLQKRRLDKAGEFRGSYESGKSDDLGESGGSGELGNFGIKPHWRVEEV